MKMNSDTQKGNWVGGPGFHKLSSRISLGIDRAGVISDGIAGVSSRGGLDDFKDWSLIHTERFLMVRLMRKEKKTK